MSVAFDTNRFHQGMWIYKSAAEDDQDQDQDQDSTTSSSIGNNSEDSGDDDVQVQSLFKGSLTNLCALEDALPVKKGISTFYAGKSKSYTSLADAVSAPSIQDIVKPEDAYNRKRKNMLAHTVLLGKNRIFTCNSTGISKRLANSDTGVLHSNHHDSGEGSSHAHAGSLPPLPTRTTRLPTTTTTTSNDRIYCSPWRSLSLSDLQHAAATATSSSSNKRDK